MDKINIFEKIVIGVMDIHNHGYMHRDLKLSNIILHEDNKTPKIIDFGIAKKLRKGEYSSTSCGTIPFMSPQAILKSPYTAKTDSWSLGIIIYIIFFH